VSLDDQVSRFAAPKCAASRRQTFDGSRGGRRGSMAVPGARIATPLRYIGDQLSFVILRVLRGNQLFSTTKGTRVHEGTQR